MVNNRLVRKAAAVLIGVATIANVAYYDAEIVSRPIRVSAGAGAKLSASEAAARDANCN